MYLDGIEEADELIYIENQYFSSKAVFKALIERMRKKDRPLLQIVIVLPPKMKSLIEDLALGFTQSRMLRCLKKVGDQTGHEVGIYFSTAKGSSNEEIPKLIHSKLFLVDDKFLSVGSANLANRSMGLDTELNVSWEGAPGDKVIESIRNIRIDLLSEHSGLTKENGKQQFSNIRGLVQNLNNLAETKSSNLRNHQMETRFHWLRKISFLGINMDPEKPFIEEIIFGWLHRL